MEILLSIVIFREMNNEIPARMSTMEMLFSGSYFRQNPNNPEAPYFGNKFSAFLKEQHIDKTSVGALETLVKMMFALVAYSETPTNAQIDYISLRDDREAGRIVAAVSRRIEGGDPKYVPEIYVVRTDKSLMPTETFDSEDIYAMEDALNSIYVDENELDTYKGPYDLASQRLPVVHQISIDPESLMVKTSLVPMNHFVSNVPNYMVEVYNRYDGLNHRKFKRSNLGGSTMFRYFCNYLFAS